MARIAGIDLPRNKRIEVALTYIYGVGRTSARSICDKAGVETVTKTDHLSEAEVIKLVREEGWELVKRRGKGSHRVFRHPTKRGLIVVPGQDKHDLKPGTLASIMRALGTRR